MLRFLIEKEFKQILRNKLLPRMIFGYPLMMMFVMPWAANQEVKNINVCIVDHDGSSYSQRLAQKIEASTYFHLTGVLHSNEAALHSVESGKSDVILEIQPDFEKNLVTSDHANVMISANAVNGTKGGLGSSYMVGILNEYAQEIRDEWFQMTGKQILPVVHVVTQNRFNPYLDYKVYMVPALMVILLTMLCGFLPALNIVSEKETGTIEQINVTPVNKFTFIMAKLIPYWAMGFTVLSVCFGLAALVYGLIPLGNIGVLYFSAGVYILVVSGIGLVISNHSSTMQQAMFVIFFFMMIFILMSGLFTPINSMPKWAQYITVFNPLKYFMQIMRMVYLKGSGIMQLGTQLMALGCFVVVVNFWAVISYRKSH